MRILVSGGAGFKGSAVCRHLVGERGATVLNVDRLGPTSSLASLDAITFNPRSRKPATGLDASSASSRSTR